MSLFTEYLSRTAKEYGLILDEAKFAAFDRYYHLLIEWNEKINLTAITEPEEVAVKHIIDSLSCYDAAIFATGARVADVGTGAGFPGIPLKIFQPDLKLTLLDSLNKRLVFLQQVIDELKLCDVTVLHSRAEDAGKNKSQRESYRIVLSRAVARLNVLSEYCLPLVEKGGWFIAHKGAQYQAELAEADKAIVTLGGKVERVIPVQLPGLSDRRAVIYIRKLNTTPLIYPRKSGMPEKKPL
ncbi:MAG TPA: 16S rRNA (guanine(527)-N(7))-methyltransferase RsmG [Methylomusa anaerophila]|uniref:Ribosomal RNA small subunit methyltransferase G n=1 Tax=Methylomusa anaerophila TaxID=1930071 RepID=A0A348AHN2_9FIRM|nr:16S rRNA (guanine(527)-N(7))-methyltransferase RsmG [Methylomusa anaerophila]BBB90580.1 ribosomal RNA small subunit methyltransferase G [Methylomusa anaerophila]HML88813.1 16S rRNA (guanine(527)-N(7))-methyltransferase RsmG [Methylomusa anaerophila]